MKVLFITNFYPPVSRGGFEEWCQEVAHGLRGSGHDVSVLTSTYGKAALQGTEPEWVRRELLLEMELSAFQNAIMFFTRRKKREVENLMRLRQMIQDDKPDAIMIWGMWNLPRSLPAIAEKLMPGRVAYYMGDYWPTLPDQFVNYWNVPARSFFAALPKSLLRPVANAILRSEQRAPLCLREVYFPSVFLRDEFRRLGITPASTTIIYGAIDTTLFLRYEKDWAQKDPITLLYIGRLTPEKGVHTAIKAVGHLVKEYGARDIRLTIVGDGDPDYLDDLHELVYQEGIVSFVDFLPAQPKHALPALYHQADIFLFTSIWPEPFGRVIVEAMASGTPVIGSAVGGAVEILQERALTFIPENHVDLARQVKRLIESNSLREQLGTAGREWARSKFDMRRMTTEIETALKVLIN